MTATERDRERAAEVAPHRPACNGWREHNATACLCGADSFRNAIAEALAAERERARAQTAEELRWLASWALAHDVQEIHAEALRRARIADSSDAAEDAEP